MRYVEQKVVDFVLMSITPTYPLAKYGYGVPQTEVSEASEEFQIVSKFIKKPTVEVTEERLKQNVIWNGGVFAFCLGCMMNIVK